MSRCIHRRGGPPYLPGPRIAPGPRTSISQGPPTPTSAAFSQCIHVFSFADFLGSSGPGLNTLPKTGQKSHPGSALILDWDGAPEGTALRKRIAEKTRQFVGGPVPPDSPRRWPMAMASLKISCPWVMICCTTSSTGPPPSAASNTQRAIAAAPCRAPPSRPAKSVAARPVVATGLR